VGARMARWLWLGVLVVACKTEPEEQVPAGPLSGCDPLDPSVCAFPFPSSHFLIDDASSPTGKRVAFGPQTLPLNRDGVQLDPRSWNQKDGFSINSALITYFEDISLTGTVPHTDIGAYLAEDVRTVIIDTVTGERVPHWVELDDSAPAAEDSDIKRHVTVTILRPAHPYEWNRRYVVGIRNLVDQDGAAIEPSPAFLALRDELDSEDKDVLKRRSHFEDEIFPVLAEQGFERGELLLAWDFHTASRQGTLGSIEHMRDDALERAGASGPAFVIDEVVDHDCAAEGQHIARDVTGKLTAPNYTTEDRPATFLNLGSDGLPTPVGTREAPFLIRVPCSVVEGGAVAQSSPILQYGHGLLGDRGEARSGWLAEMADAFGWTIFAMDWTGFGTIDSVGITLMIAIDPSDFGFIPERSQQGLVEFVLGMRMMQGPLLQDDAMQFDGVSVVDPERRYYYGNSQGAIMGSAYMGLSPDIERGVLGVGGGPYSLLLPRSHDFDPFFLVFKEKYLDHREISLFVVGLTQQLWDPVEPGGWMWDINRDRPDPKQVLMQVAVNDNQVTTLGAHYQARALSARTIAPQSRPVWGVEESEGPWEGSALVEFLYTNLPDEPFEALPPDGPDPHECPRREPEGQLQVREFLETGVVRHTCDGPCVHTSVGVCH
jgi:hypothetical protein